jgi:replication factor C subunit 3/5
MVFLIDKYKVSKLSDIICHKKIYDILINNNNESIVNSKDSSLKTSFCQREINKYTYNIDNSLSGLLNIDHETVQTNILNCENEDELHDVLKKYNTEISVSNTNNSNSNKYIHLPNLLIYGPHGCGKKTLIKLLLEDIYNKQINNVKKVKYQITGYGNSSAEVEVEQSNYHIIIEPSNSGLDKYLIHEIVKDYAQQTILNVNNCKTPFRVVLINNIDNLSYYAQTSLRCTMEKYHKTCKFILYGYQSSKIIEPLRSRCLNIRVPCPTNKDLLKIILNISTKEQIDISFDKLKEIVILSKGNIKTAIWLLELYKSNIVSYELSWRTNLNNIINIIHDFEKNPSHLTFNGTQIQKVRDILYTIFITNVTGNQIIMELMDGLINKCTDMDPTLMSIIITLFGYYETRINKGKRSIIHLEALINSIFYHILKFKINE